MAPKKAPPNKQAREKAVEDKTFGMKNKKGSKAQKYVTQVKASMDATANRAAGKGPSKKEQKEMQKAQEAEMLALFNAVPKKNDDQKKEDEMDPDTGPTFTDITQEIEYQRANVVAKTKITDEVFQAWRAKKTADRHAAEEEARRERRKKGILTGREIFLEMKGELQDDETAAEDDDMLREVNEEDEIRKMEELSLEAQRAARQEAGFEPSWNPSQGNSSKASAVAMSLEAQAILEAEDDDDIDLDELERQILSGATRGA